MKTKDRVKEEIGLYKLFMTVALAVFISLIDWVWHNSSSSTFWSNLVVFLAVTILLVIIFILFLTIDLKIKKLDFYDHQPR